MLNPGIFLKFALQNLNRMGLLSFKEISKTVFLLTHLLVFLFVVNIIVLLLQFFYMNGDIFGYVNNFESFIMFIQMSAKWCICLYNKDKLLNMCSIMKRFWNDDHCSAAIQKYNQITAKRILLLQKVYTYSLILVSVLNNPYAILQQKLCYGEWHMEKNGMYKLAWIANFIGGAILVCFLGSYDSVYLGLCYEVQMQCKILCSHIEQLSVEKSNCESQFKIYYQKLQKYIKHHSLLLQFNDELQKFYSISLLVQYLTAAPFMCVQMYALTENSDRFLMIRYSMSFVCVVSQVMMCCISATYVEHEMSTISTAIYNSDWYSNRSVMLRTPIILMIQKAQQKVTLTACGLVEINTYAFVNLLKLAFSTCIALKGLKNLD